MNYATVTAQSLSLQFHSLCCEIFLTICWNVRVEGGWGWMKRYVGEIAGLLVPRIIDCAEEIGAQGVAGGAENHCTLAAVTLVPTLQVDLVIL